MSALCRRVDASVHAISAALSQAKHPAAFMSRTNHGSERYYPAVEKQATAMTQAVRKMGVIISLPAFYADSRSEVSCIHAGH